METKRTTGVKVVYDAQANTISWVDIEGKSASVVVDVAKLSEDIRTKALWHGIDQKVTDAGAMGMGHWDGADSPKRYATTAERMTRMRRVADNLTSGAWNVRTQSDPLANMSAEALKELMAKAQAKLSALGIAG